ncbi:MAG: polyprenyl synthetase family protein [Acidimicrobiia bacterium]|nr:polyprenyl synthetase family protein [Acidimicrobiia bacterium]
MQPLRALGLDPLAGDLERVEEALRGSVRSDDRLLGEVAGHLVGAGGKRLRPALTLGAAYAVSGAATVAPEVITGAVAVELVHLGSLYHDDVIDEAQTRRGVPSVNARWNNIVAILAGDFLLARASDRAASLGADVAGLLARTIGELCRGQVLELHHLFDADRSEEAYLSAVAGKTAALFATSCRIGGMVCGLDEPGLDALDRFGHHLGMCFQIVDDILDTTSSADDLGKPAGNDLLEGVYTLPVIYAVGRHPELREALGRRLDDSELAAVLATVRSGGAVDDATGVARDHATKAVEALRGAADGFDPEVVEALTRLVDGLVVRRS